MDPGSLVGREQELATLSGVVDGIGTRGGALVLRGEAGIGKSALLKEAADRARAVGATVATTTGTQSEARFAFGALHQLLLPFLELADALPDPQRQALDVAFGVLEGEAPDVFLVGLATLSLFAEAASQKPLLLVVEDAHWLDRASVEVLAFVGRRIEMEGVVLLFAVRDGATESFSGSNLPTLEVSGLDDAAARKLLEVKGSELEAAVQDRILSEATGNPLALLELPLAAADLDPSSLGRPLPLTARLEATFAARLKDLDADERMLLLLAALDDGNVDELGRAADDLLGRPVYLADWARAATASLGSLHADQFSFSHPLMRSAVHQAATDEQRREAHAALARALAADPDRSVWHQAAALGGPDESVALALVATAERAASRGDAEGALAALERAATLTADPSRQALRLLRAADVAMDASDVDRSLALYRDALHRPLPGPESARASYVLETMSDTWSGASVIPRFATLAEQLAAGGDDRHALDTIATVGMRAFLGPLDDRARQHVAAIVADLDVPAADPKRLSTLALLDPVGHGREVVGLLRQLTPVGVTGSHGLALVGEAASAVWADNLALPFLRSAVDGYRAEGRLVWLAQTLVLQAWVDARRGVVRDVITAADEAARASAETRQFRYVPVAQLAHAAAAGGMGDEDTARRLIAEAEAVLLPMGAHPLLALVAVARGRTALAADRPAEALAELTRIFTPTDTAYQPFVRGWALADLTEAAVHADGNLNLVRDHLHEWQKIADDTTAPHLQVQLAYANALLATAEGVDAASVEERFKVAVGAGVDGWPFYAARAQLAYGQWLRREHRDADARAPLREAGQTFDALGQQRYLDRAVRELRATGERPRRRAPDTWTQLSPQELHIAQLAAEGLSNREIGERLYLSHRTIGTHLYNLFPKLGITSRSQLHEALPPPGDR